tara:strand:+ start:1297 stop:1953 length:657 start_codon:yes stop_codon:yes gene_type:complete
MWSYLINDIELYSDRKSFSLGIDTLKNLWLLLHLKDLEIKSKTVLYQVDNGIRQRKSTKHPIRKMRKPLKNTAELIKYLRDKPYKLNKLELEFANGWKIKQLAYVELKFYTNSSLERDQLINKLLKVAGQGPINASKLEINYSYYFKSESKLIKINFDDLPDPDEFWSKEKVAQWKIDVGAVERLKEEQQTETPINFKSDLEEIKKMFSNLDSEIDPF